MQQNDADRRTLTEGVILAQPGRESWDRRGGDDSMEHAPCSEAQIRPVDGAPERASFCRWENDLGGRCGTLQACAQPEVLARRRQLAPAARL